MSASATTDRSPFRTSSALPRDDDGLSVILAVLDSLAGAVRAALSVAYASVGPTVGPLRVQYTLRRVVSRSLTHWWITLSYSDCVVSRIGVGEVASSNLVVPTIFFQQLRLLGQGNGEQVQEQEGTYPFPA